jgi:hypothetical protein
VYENWCYRPTVVQVRLVDARIVDALTFVVVEKRLRFCLLSIILRRLFVGMWERNILNILK